MQDEQETKDNASGSRSSSVDSSETRYVTIPQAIGLDFHSFIPKSDLSSQVHFFSNVRPDSAASAAGLKDGDRILQINGVNVANLEHEDVRKLMQLVAPMVFTVVYDPKYLLVLEQPVEDVEEKPPALPITRSSIPTLSFDATKLSPCETFVLPQTKDSSNDESLKGKRCRLRQNPNYDGYGLILKYQQDLHVIGAVEEASPSYDAGLRENDVILFIGNKNVEKLTHDDVKVMIRAIALTADHVELVVLPKADIPKYKTMQEKGFIDWPSIGLEKN